MMACHIANSWSSHHRWSQRTRRQDRHRAASAPHFSPFQARRQNRPECWTSAFRRPQRQSPGSGVPRSPAGDEAEGGHHQENAEQQERGTRGTFRAARVAEPAEIGHHACRRGTERCRIELDGRDRACCQSRSDTGASLKTFVTRCGQATPMPGPTRSRPAHISISCHPTPPGTGTRHSRTTRPARTNTGPVRIARIPALPDRPALSIEPSVQPIAISAAR